MILDSSAVVAACFAKSRATIVDSPPRLGAARTTLAIGAPTLFETAMVAIGRFGRSRDGLWSARFREDKATLTVAPFDARQLARR